MSVFLGETLSEVLERLGSGLSPSPAESEINLDLARIPVIAKDNTDRNRTSPFAFTGNKFEFRALGSNQSISSPIAFLNAAVAEALGEMNEKLASKANNGVASEKDILDVITSTYKEVKAVCFEGDGYSEEWHQEAENRGLPNLKDTPSALKTLLESRTLDMLVKQGIYGNKDELHARYNVLIERYNMRKLIELDCLDDLATTHVIPSFASHLNQLASSINEVSKITSATSETQKKNLESLSLLLDELIVGRDKMTRFLEKAHHVQDDGELGALLANEGMTIAEELKTACVLKQRKKSKIACGPYRNTEK